MLRAFHAPSGVRNRLAENVDTLVNDPDQIAPYLVTCRMPMCGRCARYSMKPACDMWLMRITPNIC